MGLEFNEVDRDEFLTFKAGVKPNYVQIEEALIEIGGKGVPGAKFKKAALEAAGWKYGKLISYGAHPDVATTAFNKLREVLAETKERDEILQKMH